MQSLLNDQSGAALLFIPVVVWSLAWKGLALWHAARREQKPWFIGLLVLNTMGIAEIIYLAFVAKIWNFGKKNIRS